MGPQKNSGWLQPLTNHTCTSVLACDQWRASCESKHKVRALGCLYVYIYRWVNRPREIQWLLKIAVHLGVKPVAAQTLDIWPNAPSCLLTPPPSLLLLSHGVLRAGGVHPEQAPLELHGWMCHSQRKRQLSGVICSLQRKRSWGEQPDGDFRKYPKRLLESFGGKSTYYHVSGILKCSANHLPAFRLSVPSGDW